MCGLIGNENALGEAFHITSNEALSWNKIYEILGETLGKAPIITYIPTDFINKVYPESIGPLKGDKAEHGVFDNSKIRKAVPGFQCKNIQNCDPGIGRVVQRRSFRMVVDNKQNEFIDWLIKQR